MLEPVNLRVTLGEIRKELDACEKNGIPLNSIVLWADNVEIGSDYQIKTGAIPGSVIMGITYIQDNKRKYGTLQFMPSKISKSIN